MLVRMMCVRAGDLLGLQVTIDSRLVAMVAQHRWASVNLSSCLLVATSLLLHATLSLASTVLEWTFGATVGIAEVVAPEKATWRGRKDLEQERSHNPIVLANGH